MTVIEQNNRTDSGRHIFLEPINSENPCGTYLKLDPVYDEIMKARVSDDPNLPLGEWQRDLKKADWALVKDRTQAALVSRTKDLQLAIWLLEAKTHLSGFSGFADGVILVADLTDHFWDQIFPRITDGDIEYRTNLFRWMNDKLQPVLKKIPLTSTNAQINYSWNDWERGAVAEGMPKEAGPNVGEPLKLATIQHAISLSPNEFFGELSDSISQGLAGLDYLAEVLERRCGPDAPSISGLSELLLQIQGTLKDQLKSRGLMQSEAEAEAGGASTEELGFQKETKEADFTSDYSIKSREQAYQYLSAAADYLSKEDSHSPVPYLIFKAIDWGRLNTTELYQELFVHHGGSLNIFDLVGLEDKELKDET